MDVKVFLNIMKLLSLDYFYHITQPAAVSGKFKSPQPGISSVLAEEDYSSKLKNVRAAGLGRAGALLREVIVIRRSTSKIAVMQMCLALSRGTFCCAVSAKQECGINHGRKA